MKKLFRLMIAGLFAMSLAVGCGDEGGAEEPEADFTAGSEDFGAPEDDLGGEAFGDEEAGDEAVEDEGLDDF